MTAPAGDEAELAGTILAFLAETDHYATKMQDARTVRERMTEARPAAAQPSEAAFARAFRRLVADGLVDLFHEPYIPPRYAINAAGRARAARDK